MSEMKYINDINIILRETGIGGKANKEQMNSIIKLLIKNIDDRQKDRTSDGEVYKQLTMHLRALGKIETIKTLLIEISKWVAIKRKIYNEAVLLFNLKKVNIGSSNPHTAKAEPIKVGGGHTKNRKERRAEMFKNNPAIASTGSNTKKLCDGCGRDNHLKANCELQTHPDWNKSGRWEDSEAAKTLSKGITVNGENKTFKTLQFSYRLNGSKVDPPINIPRKDGGAKQKSKFKKLRTSKSCISCNTCIDELCMLDNTLENDNPHTVISKLIVNENELTINVLFDTGALQNNYINEDTAGWITKHGEKSTKIDSRVWSAFNNFVTITNSF
jgi:hypothetical protein